MPGPLFHPPLARLTARHQKAGRDRALAMIREVAADSGPAPLVLPAGWEQAGTTSSGPYYRATVQDVGHVDADRDGVTPVLYRDEITDVVAVRALAGRLIEAAGIVQQLRAGAQ